LDFPRERFGYHVVYDRDIHDAIDFASSHGFGYIVPDMMIPRFWPERLSQQDRRRIRKHASDRGVSISFHGPSDNLNLAAPYPEVRSGILKRMRQCLELAGDLEAERFTIHPSQPPGFASAGGPGTYLEDHREIYAEALSEGIRGIVAEAGDVQVCVENEPLTPFIQEVLEVLMAEEDDLYLTLDVPKAEDPEKGAPPDQVEAFYMRHIGRVREAHLHDRRPGGHYHDMLGQGGIDAGKYLRVLAPQDVHFTLEIRPRENAHRSLVWIRGLWEELF
jgi:sugar phosphate isomerase/epimerase